MLLWQDSYPLCLPGCVCLSGIGFISLSTHGTFVGISVDVSKSWAWKTLIKIVPCSGPDIGGISHTSTAKKWGELKSYLVGFMLSAWREGPVWASAQISKCRLHPFIPKPMAGVWYKWPSGTVRGRSTTKQTSWLKLNSGRCRGSPPNKRFSFPSTWLFDNSICRAELLSAISSSLIMCVLLCLGIWGLKTLSSGYNGLQNPFPVSCSLYLVFTAANCPQPVFLDLTKSILLLIAHI